MTTAKPLSTVDLLRARYQNLPLIPVEVVAADFFAPLSTDKLVEYISQGKIALPLVRMYDTQKAAKGVHLTDLAAYIEARRAPAIRDAAALQR